MKRYIPITTFVVCGIYCFLIFRKFDDRFKIAIEVKLIGVVKIN